MLKSEFEQLAGVTVSESKYRDIEIMYINCTLDKREFIKEWEKHKDSIILNSLARAYRYLDDELDDYIRELRLHRERLKNLEKKLMGYQILSDN